MIVAELKEPGRNELLIFFTLSDDFREEVTDWIIKKVNTGEIELSDDRKKSISSIQESCLKKFGEAPKIIGEDEIQPIWIHLGITDNTEK